jgi:hypothetical protein
VGGAVDIMTAVNAGRAPSMAETEGRLLFRQYYRATNDEASAAADVRQTTRSPPRPTDNPPPN